MTPLSCLAWLPGPTRAGWRWLLLPLLALWPVWWWSALRLADGSDDPFGVIALVVLLAALWRDRRALSAAPRPGWLGLALLLAVAACLVPLPALARAVLGVLALMTCVLALRAPRQPMLAWLGLGLLALPILSSLQFFAGYPLRLITAEASRWLLQATGLEVLRQGTTLELGGRLIMVDAACSGIQMAWVAYFTACATAAWLRLSDRQFLGRVPLLGLIVLGGNILRNSLLVVHESGLLPGPVWLHEATGLVVFTGVCLLVLRHTAGAASGAAPAPPRAAAAVDSPASRRGVALMALGFVALALLPALRTPASEAPSPQAVIEWPLEYAGRPIRPLALSAVEQRFAEQFPGAIARFTDGQRLLSLRHVTAATRKLHPADDCYRGLGYAIQRIGLERRDAGHALQRCFIATRGEVRLRVCDYIEDAQGRSFTDTSSWYWAALGGQSVGPWRAVTLAQAL
ncbi:MAG: exosortase Q [Pseudomonadota bacterium]